jgi:hypothetical protein
MGHILTAISAILAIFISVLLARKSVLPEIPRLITAFSLFLILFGAGMIYYFEGEIEGALAQKHWPVTEGTVIHAEIAGTRAFRPEVTCEYQIDGHKYRLKTDLGTPGFGNKRSRRDTAGRILQEYPEGRTVQIHYDPEDPSRAFLRVGPAWNTFMKLSLGMLILITGMIGFTGNFLKRIIKSNIDTNKEVRS